MTFTKVLLSRVSTLLQRQSRPFSCRPYLTVETTFLSRVSVVPPDWEVLNRSLVVLVFPSKLRVEVHIDTSVSRVKEIPWRIENIGTSVTRFLGLERL